jgi:hypothetical protein
MDTINYQMAMNNFLNAKQNLQTSQITQLNNPYMLPQHILPLQMNNNLGSNPALFNSKIF